MDYTDIDCQKRLIKIFLNSVFVYDDKVVLTFNYSEDGKSPPVSGETGDVFIQIVLSNMPSEDCQIRTTPDHTSFTRVPTSSMSDSLAPGTAGRPVGRFYSTAVK